jgi:hypothetical protein
VKLRKSKSDAAVIKFVKPLEFALEAFLPWAGASKVDEVQPFPELVEPASAV